MKKTLLLITTALLFFASIPFQGHATTHNVEVSDFAFSPSAVPNVVVGDTIHFVWVSGSHTTTSTSVPTGAASWNSPMNSSNTTFNYLVTTPGAYSFVCNFHSNMVGTFTVTGGNTGISSVAGQSSALRFFPNPIKSDLNISFNSFSEGAGSISIYDLTGKEVVRQSTDIITGSNTLVLAVGQLQSGMYMAEVRIGNDQVGVRRIIKE